MLTFFILNYNACSICEFNIIRNEATSMANATDVTADLFLSFWK